MDISKSVTYRGIEVNGAALYPGRTLRGIAIENIDYSGVEAVGYTEKRAAADGMHASDVYLGPRMVELSGHVYASSASELFDYLHVLRAVFSPTSAYQESPGDRGFLPFKFQQPTLDLDSFPDGVIPLQMHLRPRANLRFSVNRDRIIGEAKKPTATPWAAELWAKDPRVYVDPSQSVDISGGPWTNKAGQAINRGDYETPLNVMAVVTSPAPAAGMTIRIVGFGVDMTISLLAEANRVYRWYGDDRVLMVQDSSAGASAPQVLRMDLVSFATSNRKPMVPASINPPVRPFSSSFTYTTTYALAAGSRLFWSEAFA
jgi:hypothetical protein